ncbi:hypothetical protein [uncultured Tissierella sp.]|uniref:hypothetical protein n=1 Tax=uncultured Tissierella sp. TaxID=448160 RepID=UPI0028061E86|nr:hypothetical protein [uncultured Tissierella sp.]MDU5080228.1 hypothetical protein [Bacillota bacterium]
MAGIDVIKEYLVAMGLQDNFTENFNKVIDDSSNKMGKFATTFIGKFAIAGVAVVSATAMANIAIGKFLGNMAKSDLAMEMYAKSIGKTKQEATRLDTTLKAMGRTLEEVNSNAELKANFKQLQKDAEKVQPPDMSEGMKQIREIQFEFTRLKQNATYALNWIGYYLTKYLKEPIGKIQEGFKGLNDIVIKNMPKWTEKIAKVLSWVVRLGTTLVRGSVNVFTAIKRIFDMIPKELKIVGAAITALGLLIRSGPIGKLAMVITGILLLLDDFYTYINGGDALLGGFWQRLIDIYEVLKNSGAIDRFKDNMVKAFNYSGEKINELKSYLISLFEKFEKSGSIESLIKLIGRLKDLFIELLKPVSNVAKEITFKAGRSALEWFIDKGLPKAIDLLTFVVGKVTDIITWMNKFGAVESIIKGVGSAFVTWKLGIIIADIYKATAAIAASTKAKAADTIATIASTKAKIIDKAETIYLIGLYAKDAVIKGISTAATWTQTAATTAWNVVAGIGATVTTAFGAAIAFLTSPIGLVIAAIVALIAIAIALIKNWDKVKEFFIELWDKIKNIFSGIGEWFGKTFSSAVDAIKNAFSPLVDWFKEKVDKIKGFFGGIGDKVKGIFGKDKPDPNDEPNPKPVGHSSGGVFYNRHKAEIAEDGAEAVIPLTKPNRAREILSQIKDFINPDQKSGGVSNIDGIKQALSQMTSVLFSVQSRLNEQQNISYTSNGGNVTINNITISPQTNNKIYGSGNPEATANAINKGTINSTGLLLRNTQGVIV